MTTMSSDGFEKLEKLYSDYGRLPDTFRRSREMEHMFLDSQTPIRTSVEREFLKQHSIEGILGSRRDHQSMDRFNIKGKNQYRN